MRSFDTEMQADDSVFPVYIESGETVAHGERDHRGYDHWFESQSAAGKWGIWNENRVEGEIAVYEEDEERGWEVIGHMRATWGAEEDGVKFRVVAFQALPDELASEYLEILGGESIALEDES